MGWQAIATLVQDADDNAWSLCYVLSMPRMAWNADKNQQLQQARGVSFEEVAQIIEQDGPRAILAHHNLQRYPNQRLYIVVMRGYAYIVATNLFEGSPKVL